MTVHMFITRHGKCVHNSPDAHHVWKHCNDDILGLTLEGIEQTALKAKRLFGILADLPGYPTLVADSGAIRAKQTASLIHQILGHEGGFLVDSKGSFSADRRKFLFREFPSPVGKDKWSDTFSFEKFKEDPYYNDNGWCQSFEERVSEDVRYLSNSNLLHYFETNVPYGSSPNSQLVFVGHHYALCALLTAAVMLRVNFPRSIEVSEDLHRTILKKGHDFYLNHEHIIYLTPLLTGECEPDFREAWARTEKILIEEAGFDMEGLVKCL